jgi:predicted solute-binding protein
MARGWESKSVEEQMASSQTYAPVPIGVSFVNPEVKREAEHQRTQRLRQKQALNLQRENILSQRTSNPARRSALEAALRQIEAQIEALS